MKGRKSDKVKTLKLSYPGAPNNWQAHNYINPSHPLLEKWRIVTNEAIHRADAWFVLEDLPNGIEKCQVPRNMTFFGNLETCYELDWAVENTYVNSFYHQFENIFSCYLFDPKKTKSAPPFLPWMIYANHGNTVWKQPRFESIAALKPQKKEKKISVICSNQRITAGHRSRIHFVRYLQQYFGENLVWFGNGVRPIKEKYSALAPYQYSIVLENQSRHNVVTEKLGDSFLSYTYPIYWGAKNVDTYFDRRGFSQIDLESFEEAKTLIEKALDENLFESRFEFLRLNREITLNEFNFISRILSIVNNFSERLEPEYVNTTLYSSEYYAKGHRIGQKTPSTRILPLIVNIDRKYGTNLERILTEIKILFKYNLFVSKFKVLKKSK